MKLPKDVAQATWTTVRECAARAKADLRARWSKVLQWKCVILAATAALGASHWLLLPWLYSMPWTGFGDDFWYKSDALEYRRYKTLWDWLGLLIIPILLAFGGLWFTHQREKLNREREERQREEESKLEADRLREGILQGYLDRMSELMLDKELGGSEVDDPVRSVARSRTLLVLRRLDGARKGYLVAFLHESKLITKDRAVVGLMYADLREARLGGVDLRRADLRGTILCRADLQMADLRDADLREAQLGEADLSSADLSGADLSEVNLAEIPLGGARLRNSRLYKADLHGAILAMAHLTGADLRGADLREASLREADLTVADLRGADLREANFKQANLSGSDLRRARNLTQGQLNSAWGNGHTKLPEGFVRPESWTDVQ